MARDPHAADVHATVLAALGDLYLHVDAMHQRCISHLNGGGGENFRTLLSGADDVLRVVWWLAGESLTVLREAGIVNADSTTTTTLLPENFDSDGYSDEQRKAIATLEGVVGEMEQQIFGLVQSGDPAGADVQKTEQALLMLGYLSSIGLERIEMTVHKFPSKPVPDQCPDVGHFIRELGQMYIDDPKRMTEEDNAFIGTETKPRTREIGQILHDLGGKGAMLRVHDAVLAEHGGRAAGMLRIAWSGIGLWM